MIIVALITHFIITIVVIITSSSKHNIAFLDPIPNRLDLGLEKCLNHLEVKIWNGPPWLLLKNGSNPVGILNNGASEGEAGLIVEAPCYYQGVDQEKAKDKMILR